MNIDELKNLTVSERLEVIEVLWNSLQPDVDITSPDWHQEVLKQRVDKINGGEASFISVKKLRDYANQ